MIDKLADAIAEQGETPCTKFACSKYRFCADDQLACESFRHYVRTGEALHPFMRVPLKVTSRSKPVMSDGVTPTRELFDSLRYDDDEPIGISTDLRKAKNRMTTEEIVASALAMQSASSRIA